MSIPAGDAECTTGLSKSLYDRLAAAVGVGEPASGMKYPLAEAQQAGLRFVSYALARGFAATFNAGAVLFQAAGVDVGTRSTVNVYGTGVTVTDNPADHRIDIEVTGGGGGAPAAHASTHHTGGSDALAPSDIGAEAAGTAAGLVSTEASARAAGDSTNAAAITAEAGTRAAADSALSSALSSEASTRAADDSTLAAVLSSEASTRASGDAATLASAQTYADSAVAAEAAARGTAITSEATARAAGDAASVAHTVSTTAPLTGGGAISGDPTIGISAATPSAAGSMSAADKAKLDALRAWTSGRFDQRPSASTAGAFAEFWDTDMGVTYLSDGSVWRVRQHALMPDFAGVAIGNGLFSATSVPLSGYSAGNATAAWLFYWGGGAITSGSYQCIGCWGNQGTRGVIAYLKATSSGANIDLIVITNGVETVLKSFNPASALSTGLHCLCVAPSGSTSLKWSWDGSTIATATLGGTYVTPTSTDTVTVARAPNNSYPLSSGVFLDFGLWSSQLADADIVAQATLPGSPTYALPDGAATHPAIRVLGRTFVERTQEIFVKGLPQQRYVLSLVSGTAFTTARTTF